MPRATRYKPLRKITHDIISAACLLFWCTVAIKRNYLSISNKVFKFSRPDIQVGHFVLATFLSTVVIYITCNYEQYKSYVPSLQTLSKAGYSSLSSYTHNPCSLFDLLLECLRVTVHTHNLSTRVNLNVAQAVHVSTHISASESDVVLQILLKWLPPGWVVCI